MPRQNRVTPYGEIVATPERGTFLGNRGILHDDAGNVVRHARNRAWIICVLSVEGRRRQIMRPGTWTELFFLDEATAFAAGHRPCALCRRADYVRFVETWQTLHSGKSSADAIDAQLHNERVEPSTRAQRHHHGPLDDLPDGVFVLHDGAPHLVLGDLLLTWSAAGYQSRSQRPKHTQARVITPPSLVAVLRTDWRSLVPVVHPSATTPAVRLSHRPPI